MTKTTDIRKARLVYEADQRRNFASGRWAYVAAELLECGDYARRTGLVRVLAERRSVLGDAQIVFDIEQDGGSGMAPVDQLEFTHHEFVEARRPAYAGPETDLDTPAEAPPHLPLSAAVDSRQRRRSVVLGRRHRLLTGGQL